MKVLIADKFEESGLKALKGAGCEVIYNPELKDDALKASLVESGAEVLIVRSTKVTGAMIESGRLSLIVRAGAGFDTIDVKAASARGIFVSNCPGRNSIAVAELAFALILALDRRIADNVSELRASKWNKKEYSQAKGLFGRTIGLVGLGQIAREMIPRAKAFGMTILAWSRNLTPETAESLEVTHCASIVDVAAQSDVLSVHLASTPETRNLIGQEVFDALRPRSIFINTSRADVIDQSALESAIKAKGIRAGLDVFKLEPSGATGDFADPIVALPGVYGTHHIGASTEQAQEAIAAETVRIVTTFKETGSVPNVVNLSEATPATHLLVVRHYDRPGVLAHVLNAIKAANINVQEMENIVFAGAESAIARIALDSALSDETLERIFSSNAYIIDVNILEIK